MASDEHTAQSEAKTATASPFIGRYNGNSFETAQGLEIRAGGRFLWGLSVGGLDLRAEGNWREDNGSLVLTSDPKPVRPEFRLSGLSQSPDSPLLTITLPDGRPYTWPTPVVECADGELGYGTIDQTGAYRPEKSCEEPVAITLRRDTYTQDRQTFVLADYGWKPGMTVMLRFEPNDIGVADLTGAILIKRDENFELQWGNDKQVFRKIAPASD